MELKERIRLLAKERGMSLPNLEAELGFGNSTILKWSTSSPNIDKLRKVADYFDVSLDYLMGREKNNIIEIKKLANPQRFAALARQIGEMSIEDQNKILDIYDSTIDLVIDKTKK